VIIKSKPFIASELWGCGDPRRLLKFSRVGGRSHELRGLNLPNLPLPGQFEHWFGLEP